MSADDFMSDEQRRERKVAEEKRLDETMIPDEFVVIAKSYKDEGILKITSKFNEDEDDDESMKAQSLSSNSSIQKVSSTANVSGNEGKTRENTPPDESSENDLQIPQISTSKVTLSKLGEFDKEIFWQLDQIELGNIQTVLLDNIKCYIKSKGLRRRCQAIIKSAVDLTNNFNL